MLLVLWAALVWCGMALGMALGSLVLSCLAQTSQRLHSRTHTHTHTHAHTHTTYICLSSTFVGVYGAGDVGDGPALDRCRPRSLPGA